MLKSSFYHDGEDRVDFPCVGDFVFLQYNTNGILLISSDFSGHVAGYVTLAWQSGGKPIVILTKADLDNDFDACARDLQPKKQ
ncbi:MAG: hypothetical protein FWE34_05605 [Defluviitaleaceae bacterium]|nr:hypothetical protein [Defluviitaleaceae bacterium]